MTGEAKAPYPECPVPSSGKAAGRGSAGELGAVSQAQTPLILIIVSTLVRNAPRDLRGDGASPRGTERGSPQAPRSAEPGHLLGSGQA